jgi:osmotically-inducible protein OsmY
VCELPRGDVVPRQKVTVSVTDGWVTLKGHVAWQYQKDAATRAVRDLAGVLGVSNHIWRRAHRTGR